MTEAIVGLLAGLLIGSFLNVCIYRMPRDLSVIRPRSYCPACRTPIPARDNIPVVSYLLLGGRCRHCAASIPLRYPAVELLTAALFAVTAGAMGFSLATVKWCLFEALMVGLTFSDLEERILPDEFTLGGAAAGLLLSAWVNVDPGYAHLLLGSFLSGRWLSVAEAAAGAVVGSGLLWLIGWLYHAVRRKEGVGLGDVKMLATTGAFLGLHGTLQALVIGSLAGSVIGLVYIKLAGKDYATYPLPLGAFLGAAAIFVALLQGPFPR